MQPYGKDSSSVTRWSIMVIFASGLYALIVGAVVWRAAAHLRLLPSDGAIEATVGPLKLLHIDKIASQNGGYTLTFAFYAGLFIGWAICCGVVGLSSVAFSRHRQRTKHIRSP